jgi:hypothetical protein
LGPRDEVEPTRRRGCGPRPALFFGDYVSRTPLREVGSDPRGGWGLAPLPPCRSRPSCGHRLAWCPCPHRSHGPGGTLSLTWSDGAQGGVLLWWTGGVPVPARPEVRKWISIFSQSALGVTGGGENLMGRGSRRGPIFIFFVLGLWQLCHERWRAVRLMGDPRGIPQA